MLLRSHTARAALVRLSAPPRTRMEVSVRHLRVFGGVVPPTPLASDRLMPQFESLTELMVNAANRYGDKPFLGTKRNGKYEFDSYAEVNRQVDICRAGFKRLGVKKGDAIAVISRNNLQWVLSAYGGYGVGATHVPMYEQQKESEWRYIIEDSGASILLVSTKEIYGKVVQWAASAGIKKVLCCELPVEHPDSFEGGCMELGRKNPSPLEVHARPGDLATLIYTSGTTGAVLSNESVGPPSYGSQCLLSPPPLTPLTPIFF